MPRKANAKAKAAVSSKAAKKEAPQKKVVRRRVGGVRKRIMKLLAEGPKTRAELLKHGKFSDAALYLNLKSLRKENLIEEDASNRTLRLASGTTAAPLDGEVVQNGTAYKPQKMGRPKASSASLPIHVPRALQAALSTVTSRLSPIDRPSEKLAVLQELVRTTPAPIAKILDSLADDVKRLSASLTE
jgi:hypothetical protein